LVEPSVDWKDALRVVVSGGNSVKSSVEWKVEKKVSHSVQRLVALMAAK
jgi:hypothetical protein